MQEENENGQKRDRETTEGEERETLSEPPPCNWLAGWRNNPPAHLFRFVVRRVGSIYLSTVAAEWRYFNCALILTTGRSAGSPRPSPLLWSSPSHDSLYKYIAGTTKYVIAYSEASLSVCPINDNNNREYQPVSLAMTRLILLKMWEVQSRIFVALCNFCRFRKSSRIKIVS